MSDHNKTIFDMITYFCDRLICKLVPPLLKNLFFTLCRPILHITAQIKCPKPCFQGRRSLRGHPCFSYVCPWHAVQILKCQQARIYASFRCISANIAGNLRGFFRASTYEIVLFYNQMLTWGSIHDIVNNEIPLSSLTN